MFKFVVQLSHSLILATESSNMAPHSKELSEDLKRHIFVLHEDGLGYKKIANTLKLSFSTVAKIIQRFKRAGSTQNRPRVGCSKKLSARAERYIQMLSLKDRRRSVVSITAERLKRWGWGEYWLFEFQVHKQRPKQLLTSETPTEKMDKGRKQKCTSLLF